MVKHPQTICWQQPTNCFKLFDYFVGLAFRGLTWTGDDFFNNLLIDFKIDVWMLFKQALMITESYGIEQTTKQ